MSALKIEVCKGQAGLALYVNDVRQAGVRHNGVQETILRAVYQVAPSATETPETVERTARAIARCEGKDPDALSHNSFHWWRHYVPHARAALSGGDLP